MYMRKVKDAMDKLYYVLVGHGAVVKKDYIKWELGRGFFKSRLGDFDCHFLAIQVM